VIKIYGMCARKLERYGRMDDENKESESEELSEVSAELVKTSS
jgi:hypothetical protein